MHSIFKEYLSILTYSVSHTVSTLLLIMTLVMRYCTVLLFF